MLTAVIAASASTALVLSSLSSAPVVQTVLAGTSATSPAATYTATETIPVPPASSYAGSGGGDGWALAMTPTSVYNVFHHSGTLQVACHLQADASPCWAPETITDSNGDNFATSGQPGLWLDQTTGKLYVFATRTSDATGGVVCIDTTQAASNTDPFCGFTALTGTGDAPLQSGISAISDPVVVGSHWYAFNYVSGQAAGGSQNMLLCFDLTSFGACGSQPFSAGIGSGTVSDSSFPPPAVAGIGSQVIVPVTVGGTDELACFDGNAGKTCSGDWPVPLGFGYDSQYGAPFPMMDNSGAVTGLCLPSPGNPCYTLAGASASTPSGMTGAIDQTSGWNGPAFTLGPRVYVPNANQDRVDCYDYSASAQCANFPKTFNNLGLLYTTNADPQRPTCIWVNSDNGTGQIQNFDAYTGGACGKGPIRVLASSMVAPTQLCTPASYSSLQVTSPAPSTYSSGTVAFEDGDGNPISGIGTESLDATGAVSMAGLNLSTSTGLPEFLITLNGEQGAPSSVVVKLTWTGTDDPSCVKPGTVVSSSKLVVAFGDSVAAGEGIGPSTGYPDNPGAYSNVLAAELGWSVDDFAISGACAGGCNQSILGTELPAAESMHLKPNLVTVTVGADDIQFGNCFLGTLGVITNSPCNGQTFTNNLNTLKVNLGKALSRISADYPGTPIAITQYYNPLPTALTSNNSSICSVISPLLYISLLAQHQYMQAADLSMDHLLGRESKQYQQTIYDTAVRVLGSLNKVIGSVASNYKNVTAVPVDFTGHDFCQDYPGGSGGWVFGPSLRATFGYQFGLLSNFYQAQYSPNDQCNETIKGCYYAYTGSGSGDDWGFKYNYTYIFSTNDFPHPTPGGQKEIANLIKTKLKL